MTEDYSAFRNQQPIVTPTAPKCCRFCGAGYAVNGYCSDECLTKAHQPILVFDEVYGIDVTFMPPLSGWKVGMFRGQRVNGIQVDVRIEKGGLVWRHIRRVE